MYPLTSKLDSSYCKVVIYHRSKDVDFKVGKTSTLMKEVIQMINFKINVSYEIITREMYPIVSIS